MMRLLENPTNKDVQNFVFYAMNKPSNMSFEAACALTAIQFGLTSKQVSQMIYNPPKQTDFEIEKTQNIH